MYCIVFAIAPAGCSDLEEFVGKAFENLPRLERDGEPCYDSLQIGCHGARGLLWRDRFGEFPPGMSFPEPRLFGYDRNEARIVADVPIDDKFFPIPEGYFTPDTAYHPVGHKRADWWAFRETVLSYPDHLLVPLACHC